MSGTTKTVDGLNCWELAEVAARTSAARSRFAHSVDDVGDIPGPLDPDDPPLAEGDLTRLRQAAKAAPALVAAGLRRVGRPRSPAPKVSHPIRLDPDFFEALRSRGDGWQGRVNPVVRRSFGLDRPKPPTADDVDRVAQDLVVEVERVETLIRGELEEADVQRTRTG